MNVAEKNLVAGLAEGDCSGVGVYIALKKDI
jgi:hypothetical protein